MKPCDKCCKKYKTRTCANVFKPNSLRVLLKQFYYDRVQYNHIRENHKWIIHYFAICDNDDLHIKLNDNLKFMD